LGDGLVQRKAILVQVTEERDERGSLISIVKSMVAANAVAERCCIAVNVRMLQGAS
jgi:hypothetical protein